MPMKELIDAGLFGLGLVEIKGGDMMRRYNNALDELGFKTTRRKKIHVDRSGWSPELAADLENDYYLSHGPATPFAIVLAPEQRKAPIYYPHRSFDWDMLDIWYAQNATQVAELTKKTGICLSLDQGIDAYRSPEDLRLLTSVVLEATTPDGIMPAASTQQKLVDQLVHEPDGYFDEALIGAVLESRSAIGDVRGRSLVIENSHYSNVTDFYDRAFGGTFVLRSGIGDPLILCRDRKLTKGHPKLLAADREVIPVLRDCGYISDDVSWWRDHLWRLRIIQESFLMDILDEAEPELNFLALNSAQRKGVVQRHTSELDEYLALGEVIKRLEDGETPEHIEDAIKVHLLHAHGDLSNSSRTVVGQLLTYLSGGRNVVRFYRHQKTAFVEAFTTQWNLPKKEWAKARIRENYEHASNTQQQT